MENKMIHIISVFTNQKQRFSHKNIYAVLNEALSKETELHHPITFSTAPIIQHQKSNDPYNESVA